VEPGDVEWKSTHDDRDIPKYAPKLHGRQQYQKDPEGPVHGEDQSSYGSKQKPDGLNKCAVTELKTTRRNWERAGDLLQKKKNTNTKTIPKPNQTASDSQAQARERRTRHCEGKQRTKCGGEEVLGGGQLTVHKRSDSGVQETGDRGQRTIHRS